ncbi:MAG: zinc ribbon domain-containing protein [Bdellovibrionales bacterium]|nr:zinc ribbon domain-containing protein [Bdellovibrionales bacterium]
MAFNVKESCHRCLMPFKNDPGSRESDIYCSYCFKNGALMCPEMYLKAFQKMCYQQMTKRGMNKWLAGFYAFTIRFAPYWKNSN